MQTDAAMDSDAALRDTLTPEQIDTMASKLGVKPEEVMEMEALGWRRCAAGPCAQR